MPHPSSYGIVVTGHTERIRRVAWILELDRTHAAGTDWRELVVQLDGIIRSGAGVHRLLQGEGGDAVGRRIWLDQRGIEGVETAAGIGAPGLDDAVGRLTDLTVHDPRAEVEARKFEATVPDDGTAACWGCCCGRCWRS